MREGLKSSPAFYYMKVNGVLKIVHINYNDLPKGEVDENSKLVLKVIKDKELYTSSNFKIGFSLEVVSIDCLSDFEIIKN